MATLARHQYGLVVPFHVAKLEERNVWTGFFEEEQFAAAIQHLAHRRERQALLTAAKLTGWRKSELQSRQWRHVDFSAGWLRLEPEETKNREGRQFPLIPELRQVLEAQHARVQAIQRATGRVIPHIFVRDDGAPVGDWKKAWTTARRKAGIPGRLFHDFRRTAVRNLIRAGIPETVAMKLTGHRTRSVFSRYAIVEEGMLREAGERLAASRLERQRSPVRGT
jgi:integrase